jgi:CheY-like chemotaxis protein
MPPPLTLRLLIVEDDADLRTITSLAVGEQYDGSEGIRVETILAATAEEAITKLQTLSCDMILTDQRLPHIKGDMLIKMLRVGEILSEAEAKYMPVIMTSADRPMIGIEMIEHPFPHYRYTDDQRKFFLEKDADFERLFSLVDYTITLIIEGTMQLPLAEKRVIV